MNFSELFKQSSFLSKFSPDGKYLASCVSYKLIVREVETLQILRLYTCVDVVQHLSWSSDSAFILCAMYKRGMVQVWSVDQPDWTCKIDEGSAGLMRALWSPDGRHILTTANFNLRITVWSLVNKSVSYVRYVKNSKDCLSFSKDGKYLALGENRKCKDYISIFDVESWQMLKIFECETEDMSSLEWSPDGRVICVADNMLWYKILIYTMDGRRLATYKAYEWALGVKKTCWSPTSQFLAVSSYDRKVRVLNHITWKSISEFEHAPNILTGTVYQEEEMRPKLPGGEEIGSRAIPTIFSTQSRYGIAELPTEVPFIPPDTEKPNPKIGATWMEFSPDNKFLATIDESMKSTVFIWSMQKLTLHVVLQQVSAIKAIKWDPKSSRLAVGTGNDKIYLWSPSGSVSVQVPVGATFHVHSIAWHPDGNSLIVMSKDQMCVCYLEQTAAK